MSYDPDSAEAKKGALGEEIARKCLEGLGATITRPDEFGAKGLVDFLAVPKAGSSFAARYVEVKVRRSAFPYAHGQYPCYAFRVVQRKEFPFDQETKIGLLLYYHQKQFDTVRNMNKADSERLRAIESNKLTISATRRRRL